MDEVRLTPWKDALREWYEPNLYHFAGAVTALWVYQCYGIFTRLMARCLARGAAFGLLRFLRKCSRIPLQVYLHSEQSLREYTIPSFVSMERPVLFQRLRTSLFVP